MKKLHVDHILRAAGRITGEKTFLIVGSQSLHGTHPDLADDIVSSAEVDKYPPWVTITGRGLSDLGAVRLQTHGGCRRRQTQSCVFSIAAQA